VLIMGCVNVLSRFGGEGVDAEGGSSGSDGDGGEVEAACALDVYDGGVGGVYGGGGGGDSDDDDAVRDTTGRGDALRLDLS